MKNNSVFKKMLFQVRSAIEVPFFNFICQYAFKLPAVLKNIRGFGLIIMFVYRVFVYDADCVLETFSFLFYFSVLDHKMNKKQLQHASKFEYKILLTFKRCLSNPEPAQTLWWLQILRDKTGITPITCVQFLHF